MKTIETYPIVTVQLPVYNEVYVVGRLIDAACAMIYPKEKLEIQVLDDSTDRDGRNVLRTCGTVPEAGI